MTGKANQARVSKAMEFIEKAKGWCDQPSRATANEAVFGKLGVKALEVTRVLAGILEESAEHV